MIVWNGDCGDLLTVATPGALSRLGRERLADGAEQDIR